MWLMTPGRGFYSVVQHRDDPTRVLVRARNEEDIRNLADLIPDAEPWRLKRSDYEWRLECPLSEWVKACSLMALEIDYPNVKNAVKDKERASIYMRVWSALYSLERLGKRRRQRAPLYAELTTCVECDEPLNEFDECENPDCLLFEQEQGATIDDHSGQLSGFAAANAASRPTRPTRSGKTKTRKGKGRKRGSRR